MFVSIPEPAGSVLVLLDKSGSPRPGWPITVEGSVSCPGLLPVEDGTVRLLCTTAEEGTGLNELTAFAFDQAAVPLPGWPVDLGCCIEARRVIGDTLTVLRLRQGTEPAIVQVVKVDREGATEGGVEAAVSEFCCSWSIAPNGIAFGTARVSGLDMETPERSELVVVGPSGGLGDPIPFPGLAGAPAAGGDGRVLVTTGSLVRPITQVHAFDARTGSLQDSSPELDTVTAGFGDTGGCGFENPTTPLVAGDGTIYVLNWAAPVFALDPLLQPRAGWPYGPATPLALRDARYVREDASCPSSALAAAGVDGTLYLPLEQPPTDTGGSIVALGPDGRVREGWPVTIQRENGEFWSVTAAPDGTAYALAVELESPTTSSATVVGIAPDSTVLFSTTVVDP